jgi:glycogen operon protein
MPIERPYADPRARLLALTRSDFAISPGQPLPFGVTRSAEGLNFSLFSKNATAVSLVLFAIGDAEPFLELPLDDTYFRTGNVWHIAVAGLDRGFEYGWRLDRQPLRRDRFHWYDPTRVLVDPYARAISTVPVDRRTERRSLFYESTFDWKYVRQPRVPLEDKIIYEVHLRGFTRHPSSGVRHPGTYRGFIEKIPYLKELGVTTVELLPVYEFDESTVNPALPDELREALTNYWGYNPICFFAPMARYAADGRHGEQVDEFKLLVRELHKEGIEVLLDVVFNHTAEGSGEPGTPMHCFRGIDNSTYYMLDPETGAYLDFTGCGNTLNCNHPVVREMVLDTLRYWGGQMEVDGFRFDLASALSRGRDGRVLADPPLIETIAEDPVLANLTLIAEAWDAAGLYQVGTFPSWGRWCEWNGPFRDDVRQFLRGDGFAANLASRLAGSADLYLPSGRKPHHSINFVTCHDGFTLADLVSYDRKHNESNGEENRDGTDANFSWNCGVEGPTSDPNVVALRSRQVRNALTILFLSQGVPMILAGDELGRTQEGNNNAYCHDNEISWIDWSLEEKNAGLLRFTKLLIAFRKTHPILRRTSFFTGKGNEQSPRPDVTWHGVLSGRPDFDPGSRALAMQLAGEHAPSPDCDIYFAANAWAGELEFQLPPPPDGTRWARVVDTALESPHDIADEGHETPVLAATYRVAPFSCVVLRSVR